MASLADMIEANRTFSSSESLSYDDVTTTTEHNHTPIQSNSPIVLPNNFHGRPLSVLTSGQRLAFGILILVLVDIIWVGSSELTEYIFHDENFNKPFFSTYLKTSMFILFLVGFLFWTPWLEQCSGRHHSNNSYLPVQNPTGFEEHVDVVDDNANESPLSPSTYIPINYEPSSGNESSEDSTQQRSVRFNKIAEVRHLSESEAAEAVFARLSYQATVQAEQTAQRKATKLGLEQTAQLSLAFCLLWFGAGYTYQLAISNTEAGIVNVISSSSCLFTLILTGIFPSVAADKFSLSKSIAVLLSVAGVIFYEVPNHHTNFVSNSQQHYIVACIEITVTLSDLSIEQSHIPFGAIFAVLSSFFYASYLVFLRKKVDHEDKLDIPMFFGFVGLFNLIILWPLFFVFNYTGVEVFEIPDKRQWLFLIVNAIIGTVFSEVLWLWGCFLTSSLIATLAISLTIPMSMIADVIMKGVSYSVLFYLGTIPILLSFGAVTLLSHYEGWDPVLDILKYVKHILDCKKTEARYQRVLVNENDPRESLIGINYDGSHDDSDEESSQDVEISSSNARL